METINVELKLDHKIDIEAATGSVNTKIMEYEEMCKFIFEQEGFETKDMTSKSREAGIKTARQICVSIGREVLKKTLRQLAAPFGQDHATIIHSIKTVKSDCETNKLFSRRVDAYVELVRRKVEDGRMAAMLALEDSVSRMEEESLIELQ